MPAGSSPPRAATAAGGRSSRSSRPRAARARRRSRDRGEARAAARGRARLVRRDRRRHVALLPRADAGDARPHQRAAHAVRPRRPDAEERPPEPPDARAPLVPDPADPVRLEPRQLEGRDVEEGGRGRARHEDRVRGAVRPSRPARRQPRQPRGAQRRRLGVRGLDQAAGTRPRHGEPGCGEEAEEGPLLAGEGVGMGLHDRIKGQESNGVALVPGDALARPAPREDEQERRVGPYAELKTRIHHACIAKLGPELFKRETTEDLTERVLRTVTEQLALDRTPLTREERRQITREITDDILGYGPLEPLLRDDSITEVMVNDFDKVYIEREGKIDRTPVTFVDNAHLLRIIDKIVSQVGRRIDEASPMVDARLPDGSRVNAIIPPLSLKGPTLTIRKFSRDPYTMDDLIDFGTLTPEAAQFLMACVRGKLNVLISGGTGTGKTTTLNALSAFIPG